MYIQNEFNISSALLDKLEEDSLLRKERDAEGRWLFELSHDSWIEPIQKIREDRHRKLEIEKNEKLQRDLESESKRVNELEQLNTKVKQRSWLAWGISILAIAVAIVAIRFQVAAKKANDQAQESNKKANQNSMNFRLEKANNYLQKGIQYEQLDEPDWAISNLDSAMVFLKEDNVGFFSDNGIDSIPIKRLKQEIEKARAGLNRSGIKQVP